MNIQPSKSDQVAIDTLARTVYGEARGEGLAGKVAVANVVMNRVAVGYRGDTVEAVCKAPYQFSCWNENDPNRKKIEAVSMGNSIFAECHTVARLAVADLLKDRTLGARHYHTKATGFPKVWGVPKEPSAVIGNHLFYNNVE